MYQNSQQEESSVEEPRIEQTQKRENSIEEFSEVAKKYESNEMDEQLEAVLSSHTASIKIFGVGVGETTLLTD